MPDAPIRVLLVAAASSTSGGGERHVADLLRGLPERGVEPVLACPPGGDLPALARDLGVVVETLDIAAGFRPSGVSALRAAIARVTPDLVHAHGSRAAFYARLADRDAGARVVYTLHGIHVDKAGSAPRRFTLLAVERWLRARTARFIAVCRSDLAKGARLGVLDPARTDVVHNGIPLPAPSVPHGGFRAELGVHPDAPLVLSVGRFHEQKDQATLLRAWAEASRTLPGAVLALVGAGELDAELRALADALGDGCAVRFVAPRPDLAPAYADADVFVLSSRWEGLPYVVLEGMAHGLPVVATAVDGIPEAVKDRASGLLVPAADTDALAAALGRVLEDPGLRACLGEAGRRRVEASFTLGEMLDRTVAVYYQTINRNRADS